MRYIVAGYGRFGRLAAARLTNHDRDCSIIVVEQDGGRLSGILPARVTAFNDDVISFILDPGKVRPEDIILPMVPFHLIASLIVSSIPGCKEIPFPEQLGPKLPNPFVLNQANLCCSRADFICPDDCPEGDLCTVTGLPRDPLYEELERLEVPGFTVLVQRSFQILPGLGGYPMEDVHRIQRHVKSGAYLVATSCKCHAVLTALHV
ncbi:MAG: hypothetical protein RDU20_00335 [Desulfomonilaceae bacterium]|nr:hypothetical protein [Desulfomonilaceae bacterium]